MKHSIKYDTNSYLCRYLRLNNLYSTKIYCMVGPVGFEPTFEA